MKKAQNQDRGWFLKCIAPHGGSTVMGLRAVSRHRAHSVMGSWKVFPGSYQNQCNHQQPVEKLKHRQYSTTHKIILQCNIPKISATPQCTPVGKQRCTSHRNTNDISVTLLQLYLKSPQPKSFGIFMSEPTLNWQLRVDDAFLQEGTQD